MIDESEAEFHARMIGSISKNGRTIATNDATQAAGMDSHLLGQFEVCRVDHGSVLIRVTQSELTWTVTISPTRALRLADLLRVASLYKAEESQ